MANHRWETSPSVPRLFPSLPGPASVEDSAVASGEPEPDESESGGVSSAGVSVADDQVRGGSPVGHRRRWLMSFRASVLAVSLLVGAVAGLVVFKGGEPPAEVTSVELDLDRSASPAGDGDAPGTGEDPTDQAQSHDQAQTHGQGQENDGEAMGLGQQAPGSGNDGGPAGRAASPSVLVIHVAGAVTRPGVVRIPSGSRTGDAVDAAGGAAPDADLTAVNLAAPLQDGAMVIVPRIGEEAPAAGAVPGGSGVPGSAPGPGPEPGAGTGVLVNINTASVQDLDALPRVGPVIAERIIAWRTEHGRFARPEDIDAVPGIGEAMLAALLPLITV